MKAGQMLMEAVSSCGKGRPGQYGEKAESGNMDKAFKFLWCKCSGCDRERKFCYDRE